MATSETQYRNFLKDNPNSNIPFEQWTKVNSRLIKQAIINMMKKDEELGLYDETDKCKSEQETKELNPYIGPFLLKNGFTKHKDNVYCNLECIVTVGDGDYEINFETPEHGPLTMYTSWSIPHLVGTLTWHDLIDKNYKK